MLTPTPLQTIMLKLVSFLLLLPAVSSFSAPTTVAPPPPKVVLSPLPTLHVYDHCPFCGKKKAGGASTEGNDLWTSERLTSERLLEGAKRLRPLTEAEGAHAAIFLRSFLTRHARCSPRPPRLRLQVH